MPKWAPPALAIAAIVISLVALAINLRVMGILALSR